MNTGDDKKKNIYSTEVEKIGDIEVLSKGESLEDTEDSLSEIDKKPLEPIVLDISDDVGGDLPSMDSVKELVIGESGEIKVVDTTPKENVVVEEKLEAVKLNEPISLDLNGDTVVGKKTIPEVVVEKKTEEVKETVPVVETISLVEKVEPLKEKEEVFSEIVAKPLGEVGTIDIKTTPVALDEKETEIEPLSKEAVVDEKKPTQETESVIEKVIEDSKEQMIAEKTETKILFKPEKGSKLSDEPKVIPDTLGVKDEKNDVEMKSIIEETLEDAKDSQDEPKTKKEKKPQKSSIRTYQDDVVNVMKSQKTSLTKMVVAEKKKQERTGSPRRIRKEEKSNTALVIGAVLVSTILAIATFGYFYLYQDREVINEEGITVTELKIPSFFFTNYQKEVFLSNLKRTKLVENLMSQKQGINIPLNSIIKVFLTKEDKTKRFFVEETQGHKLLVTSEVFLNSMSKNIPNVLLRTIKPDFIFGFHSSLGNNPFLMFRVDSFENAFAGMLEWEDSIIRDLSPIFDKETVKVDKEDYVFEDVIVSNKDVRAVLNSEGVLEFAYFIYNDNTLVIVNNETTIQELTRRLTNVRLERRD